MSTARHPGPLCPISLCAALLAWLGACTSATPTTPTTPTTPDCSGERWLGAWAQAPTDAGAVAIGGRSLRLLLTPLRSGETVRLTLTNRFGTEPVEVESLFLGHPQTGPALQPGSQRPILFDGSARVRLAPGEDRVSDPLAFDLYALEPVAVSLHLPEPALLTRHFEAQQTSWLADPAAGDVAAAPEGTAFIETTTERPLLLGLSVLGPASDSLIAFVGDSLTDGTGGRDQDSRYPDAAARRLLDTSSSLSPINLGIGGNRLLEDGLLPWFGPATLDRLEADVLARTDLSDVVLWQGINDLGIPPGATADEVLAGLEQVIALLHGHDPALRVTVGTLTPAGAAEGIYQGHADAEDERQRVNEALRAGGIGDILVDFDAAVRDPLDPSRIDPAFDGGDGLHFNAAGYARLAETLALDAFAGRSCDP